MSRSAVIIAAALALAACEKSAARVPPGYAIARQCKNVDWAIWQRPNGSYVFRGNWTGTEHPMAPGVPFDEICL